MVDPLLFDIFINKLMTSLLKSSVLAYADNVAYESANKVYLDVKNTFNETLN